jgi:hypothetical protein
MHEVDYKAMDEAGELKTYTLQIPVAVIEYHRRLTITQAENCELRERVAELEAKVAELKGVQAHP